MHSDSCNNKMHILHDNLHDFVCGFSDSWGKWGQMCKASTAILMCIIYIVLIKYVTKRQTIHTQHSMIVIQKATCFRLQVTTIIRLAVSSPQWSNSVDICVTKIDSPCMLWISHYTVYQQLYRVSNQCITNITEYLTDNWLTTFTFFNHPHLAYQSTVWNFYCRLFAILRFLHLS